MMRLTDRIFAVGLFVLFLTAYYTALSYPPASAGYPKLLLNVGMVLSVGLFARSFFVTSKDKAITITKHNFINLLISLVLMTLYVIAIPVIGYLVSTFAYMVTQMWILNRKSKISTIFLIAVVVIIMIYIVFGMLLNVFLPKGMLM